MHPGLVLALALGSWMVAIGSKTAMEVVRLRRLVRAPRAAIADVVDGARCRVVGVIAGEDTLTAPFSGRPCVAYDAVIEDPAADRATALRDHRRAALTVADGTGRAVVDPTGAELWLEQPALTWAGTFGDHGARDQALLASAGGAAGWYVGMPVRFVERILAVGDRVAVIGHAVREPDPDGAQRATGYRDVLPTRARLQASRGRPLIVTDRGDLTDG